MSHSRLSSGTDARSVGRRAGSAGLAVVVSRVAEGDGAALREFYELTVDRVYRAALRVLQDPVLAEDAVAATYVQVWKSAGQFDPERSQPAAWVAMIARSRAMDLARGTQRGRAALESARADDVASPEGDEESASVFQGILQRESSECIRVAVEGLPDTQRSAIECAFFHGLSHTETAQRLGAPLGTIKSRIRAALEELRSQLGPLGAEWGLVDSDPLAGPS